MKPALVILTDPERWIEANLLAADLLAAGFDQPEITDCSRPGDLAARLSRTEPFFAFPLDSAQDGALQGMLEFMGIPYAGADQSAMVLAADEAYAAAVCQCCPGANPASPDHLVQLALTGNEQPQLAGPPCKPALAAKALAAYRDLGLSGWCLMEFLFEPRDVAALRPRLRRAWPWPDLSPQGIFRQALHQGGLSYQQTLRQLVIQGEARLAAEKSLRKHYKDEI